MNNDLISREALKKAIKEKLGIYIDGTLNNRLLFGIIDNAPTVEINTNDIEYKEYCKGLEDGKKIARPQGDHISREALKEAIETHDKFACLTDTRLVPFHRISGHEEDYEPYVKLRDIRNAIDNAPTIEQRDNFDLGYIQGLEDGRKERPQGKWIDVPCERDLLFNTGIRYTCSVCGKFNSNGHSSFCPNCGADMRIGGVE